MHPNVAFLLDFREQSTFSVHCVWIRALGMEHALGVDIASWFLRWQEALHRTAPLAKSTVTSLIRRLMLLLTDLSVASFRLQAATFLTTTLRLLQSASRLSCQIGLLNLLLELVAYLSQ